MKPLKILIDLDDTIEDLLDKWVAYLNETYGLDKTTEGMTEWDMCKLFTELSPDQVYEPLRQRQFWKRVKPLPGAIENMKKLQNDGHELYIVTASAPDTIGIKYEEVISRYFSIVSWKNIIVAYDKSMVYGDVIIDDYVKNLNGDRALKILMDMPHNQWFQEDGCLVKRAKNWNEIYKYISEYAIRNGR